MPARISFDVVDGHHFDGTASGIYAGEALGAQGHTNLRGTKRAARKGV